MKMTRKKPIFLGRVNKFCLTLLGKPNDNEQNPKKLSKNCDCDKYPSYANVSFEMLLGIDSFPEIACKIDVVIIA